MGGISMGIGTLQNYIDGEWRVSGATESMAVMNPATTEELGQVPVSPATEVDEAATAASAAQRDWRRVPPQERIQYLFKLKRLLERDFESLAQTITLECGKTLKESQGELQRAIENVEVACGIPTLMQGYNLEDIAQGIDEIMIRQPVGVAAVISPFNFPAMIPFWFMP
jgi:malonate-semialdehyde dehydrogenase (acetylating)/methylmalonate-semialdehyde dehydrogenase